MSERTDLFGLVVHIGPHFSEDHFMADLGVGELRCFLRDNLPHHLSYCVFLGAFDASVAECDDVYSGQVLVDSAGGENAVHSCAAPSDEASEIVSGVFMALEDRIASVALVCDD